jgi:hypothetical protein
MNGRGVKSIRDIVGTKDAQAGLPDGRWVRAVPEPFYGMNIQAAWEVLCGRAHAITWPTSKELADALDK